LLIYVGLLIVLSWFQSRMIFPGQVTQGRPEARVDPPGSELVTLKAKGGERVVALFGPALPKLGETPLPDARSRPTILYFYGNGNCLATCLDEFDAFRRLGANVLIAEYLGYGLSGGRASESGCYAAADAAYEHLRSRNDVDMHRIIVAGWSLGGAVAIDLASRREVAGLATFSTFTGMTEMAGRQFPYLPVALLLRHRFESERKMARVTCPVLVGHGRADGLIPFEMSERLAAAAKGPVTRLTIDDANHGDFFSSGGRRVLDVFGQFLDETGKIGPPSP
jgi:pimeloyl-ACP methyl ester carboxylesterase